MGSAGECVLHSSCMDKTQRCPLTGALLHSSACPPGTQSQVTPAHTKHPGVVSIVGVPGEAPRADRSGGMPFEATESASGVTALPSQTSFSSHGRHIFSPNARSSGPVMICHVLLHPPLPSVGVSVWMERGCEQKWQNSRRRLV